MNDIPPIRQHGSGCGGAIVAALLIAAVAVIAFFVLIVRPRMSVRPLPADAELIQRFENNRDAFERAAVLAESLDESVIYGFGRPQPAPRNQSEEELFALLRKLGIEHGVEKRGDEIVFIVASEGKRIRDFSKGYALRTSPPLEDVSNRVRIAPNLDQKSDPTTHWRSYRSLGGEWWLYLVGGD